MGDILLSSLGDGKKTELRGLARQPRALVAAHRAQPPETLGIPRFRVRDEVLVLIACIALEVRSIVIVDGAGPEGSRERVAAECRDPSDRHRAAPGQQRARGVYPIPPFASQLRGKQASEAHAEGGRAG